MPSYIIGDTPITMHEYNVIRAIEIHPELVDDVKEWDRLCSIMHLSVGSMISQGRHGLLDKYEDVLGRHNLI